MPHHPSVFASLLKPISRRRFAVRVARHDGGAYDKNFSSWDHLVTLVFAQLSGADSLRGLEAAWAVNRPHHYHLGAGRIVRSTVSDASRRRRPEIFAETFADLAGLADRKARQQGGALVKLVDFATHSPERLARSAFVERPHQRRQAPPRLRSGYGAD